VEESNFHWSCNHFLHKDLNIDHFKNEQNLQSFYMILKGQILAKYRKKIHNPNNNHKEPRELKHSNKGDCKEDETIEVYLKNGDLFSKKLQIRGYTLSSVILLEDTDVLYLENHVYLRIFEKSFSRIAKEKKFFLINTIRIFSNMPPLRINIFIENIITNVNKNQNNQLIIYFLIQICNRS